MILLIAGSRTVCPPPSVIDSAGDGLLFVLDEVHEVVSGGAKGADMAGERWAEERGIPVRRFLPDYDRLGGYYAPKMRNREMARFLDGPSGTGRAIILWDGLSGGAADMAIRLLARDIPTRVVPVDPRTHPAPGTKPDSDWGTPEWMQRQGRKKKR